MKNSVRLEKEMATIDEKVSELYQAAENKEAFWKSAPYVKLRNQKIQANRQLDYWKKREIQAYCNHMGYSDQHPYEVVRVISDKTVEIREMSTKQTVFPKDQRVGGFCAHTVDNHNQDYEYTSNPNNPVIRARWSEAKKQWQSARGRHLMQAKPAKFYDYNF